MSASVRARLLEQLIVEPGRPAGLASRDAGWTGGPDFAHLAEDEINERAKEALARGIEELSDAQELLWATDRDALLVVLQAMDAAGKDSAIEHVMSGVNPQGVQVVSFKKPSAEELDHDFLWRTSKALPERGRIGIFNRSHYEEVVALKVHPEWLGPQRLPPRRARRALLAGALRGHQRFERHLDRNRDEDRQVLPPRLEGRPEAALPRPARHARARNGSSTPPTSPSAPTGTPT